MGREYFISSIRLFASEPFVHKSLQDLSIPFFIFSLVFSAALGCFSPLPPWSDLDVGYYSLLLGPAAAVEGGCESWGHTPDIASAQNQNRVAALGSLAK